MATYNRNLCLSSDGAFSWLFLAEKTSDRLQDQMAQARKIALSHSSIATIETESFFHGKEAYLSFIGKDQEGQELAVLVAQADDAVYTYPLKEGVSSKEAASVVKEKSQDAIDRGNFWDALKANRSGKLRLGAPIMWWISRLGKSPVFFKI